MITPAIIPASIKYLQEKLTTLTFADSIQIDVVDGLFVTNISWPYEPKGEVKEIASQLKHRRIEVDLMVREPVRAGREWLASGASALIFHLETLADPEAAISLRKEFDFELGFSIANDSRLEVLYPWIEKIDFIQLMGIANIGSQGQPFDPRVLDRIAALRHLYPTMPISIDGGVNETTITDLAAVGADRFVVGSTILTSPDPKATYQNLLKITESKAAGAV